MQLKSESEQHRFISYSVGAPSGSNPSAAGQEPSATWEGAAVASVKAATTFIRGDATITIPDLANPDVDVSLDDWRSLDDQTIPNLSKISYTDLTLNNGSFEGSAPDQVFGCFYGTDHNEVGGHFNTMDVHGAFGGTRQPA